MDQNKGKTKGKQRDGESTRPNESNKIPHYYILFLSIANNLVNDLHLQIVSIF